MNGEIDSSVNDKAETSPVPDVSVAEPKQDTEQRPSFREALAREITKAKETNSEVREAKPEPKQEAKPREVIEPIAPLADMSPEERAIFEKADPTLQRYLSRRIYELKSDYSRQTHPLREKAKEYGELDEVVNPYRDYYTKRATSIPALVKRAIAWDQDMAKDPISTAREWLAIHNVDPYDLLDGSTPQPQAQPQALTQEDVDRLVQEKFERYQQNISYRNNEAEVKRFIEGKPLFKDPNTAAQLEAEMAPIVQAVAASNPSFSAQQVLERAYDMVVKSNETYSRILSSYGDREKAERARVEAEKAQKASRSISGGLSGVTPHKTGLTFRDELRLRMNGSY